MHMFVRSLASACVSMCIHEAVCQGVSNRTKTAKPRSKQADLIAYVTARLITPSATEDTFQDKSNKWNHADFHDKSCPAGHLKGTHYPDNSDRPGHFVYLCVCAHVLPRKLITGYSSEHPLSFILFGLFIPCSLIMFFFFFWKWTDSMHWTY